MAAWPRSTGLLVGPLPVVNLVVLEVALGLAVLTKNAVWLLAVLLIAVPLALGRWRGHWLLRWVQLSAAYLIRSHSLVCSHNRSITSPDSAAAGDPPSPPRPAVGSDDRRVALLRLLLPDLSIAHGTDHQREPLGLAWHQGAWTAVLEVEATAAMITPVGGSPSVPFDALVGCLEHRGVVLEAIQVISHCYSGSAALPSSSPALRSYLEVLGPLPAPARRTTWVAVRLDPRRCPRAVAERGGGVLGSHRALIGALSRVCSALESRGMSTRPLDPDQLVRAGISAAELSSAAGAGGPVALREGWRAVTAAGVGHASYVISGWGTAPNLNALTGVRVLSTTVALSLSPGDGDAEVGLRGLVRMSARSPAELEAAQGQLQTMSRRLGVLLSPLHGRHVTGLAATLPLGTPA
ncbi:MAG: type VII secretion protein EccE [Pseudonocardiaceae bacterium]